MSKRKAEDALVLPAKLARYLPKGYALLVGRCADAGVSPFLSYAEMNARLEKQRSVDFGLPLELLDLVFAHLDGTTLLLVRRVSRTWRAVSVKFATLHPKRVAFPKYKHFVPIRGRTCFVFNGTTMPLDSFTYRKGKVNGFTLAETMVFKIPDSTDMFQVNLKCTGSNGVLTRHRASRANPGTWAKRDAEHVIPFAMVKSFQESKRYHWVGPPTGAPRPHSYYLRFNIRMKGKSMWGYVTNNADAVVAHAVARDRDTGYRYEHTAAVRALKRRRRAKNRKARLEAKAAAAAEAEAAAAAAGRVSLARDQALHGPYAWEHIVEME